MLISLFTKESSGIIIGIARMFYVHIIKETKEEVNGHHWKGR